MKLRFTDQAIQEIVAARSYYVEHREELGPAAREDHHLRLGVASQLVDDALQREQHRASEAVLVGGPVEREGHHSVVAPHDDLGRVAGHALFIGGGTPLVNVARRPA